MNCPIGECIHVVACGQHNTCSSVVPKLLLALGNLFCAPFSILPIGQQRVIICDHEPSARNHLIRAIISVCLFFTTTRPSQRFNDSWDALQARAMHRNQMLRDSLDYLEYLDQVEEEEAWIVEKQHLLGSRDCGSTIAAVHGLLKKHGTFETELKVRALVVVIADFACIYDYPHM